MISVDFWTQFLDPKFWRKKTQLYLSGPNFLLAGTFDIILNRGERWALVLSPEPNDMSKVGLTAEKIDIEFNFSSEQKRTKHATQDDIVMADRCSLRFHFWDSFLGNSWTQCQFSQPSDRLWTYFGIVEKALTVSFHHVPKLYPNSQRAESSVPSKKVRFILSQLFPYHWFQKVGSEIYWLLCHDSQHTWMTHLVDTVENDHDTFELFSIIYWHLSSLI